MARLAVFAVVSGMMRDRWWLEIVLVAAVFGLTIPLVLKSHAYSGTFDEKFYLEAGLTSWRTGSNKMLMKAGTMPLPVELQTLPVYLWEKSQSSPFNIDEKFGSILAVARGVTLLFWLGLLTFGYLVARHWGSKTAGCIALLLLATEPNLIAHAGLATTDIALAAGVLAAAYADLVGRGRSTFHRVLIPGFVYGVALLCKVSALVFVPMVWVCVEAHTLWPTHGFREGLRQSKLLRYDLFWRVVVGLAVTFAYCGSDWKVETTFVKWTQSLPEGWTKSTLGPVSENLKIFTNAGEAIAMQFKHNARGHGVYVAGQWHDRAVSWYFFLALAVKLTLPLLIVIVAGMTVGVRTWFQTPAGWIALAMLIFTLNCRVQIGIRLVFPLVTFLILAATLTLTRTTKHRAGMIAAIVIVAQLASVIVHRDDLLRHANPAFGGPDRIHEWLSDSNADWGQGLPDLKAWSEGRPVAVWYFGTDPRVDEAPLAKMALHTFPPESTFADFEKALGDRVLAVGTSIQFDNPNRSPAGRTGLAWLKTLEPVGRAGPFFLYRNKRTP